MSDDNMSDLHPDLQPLAQAWLEHYTALGRKARITETWRSPDREDMLHAQGVTPQTGATCKHCFAIDGKPASKAFDFSLFLPNGDYISDGTHPWYKEAGDIATQLTLVWGGNFKHPDFDHIELPD